MSIFDVLTVGHYEAGLANTGERTQSIDTVFKHVAVIQSEIAFVDIYTSFLVKFSRKKSETRFALTSFEPVKNYVQ